MRAYLDYAAAAPLSDAVRARLVEVVELAGSAGSVHDGGRAPAELLERARAQVAALINAQPEEIIFTSGATEARNLAVKGLLRANRGLGSGVVISAIEHPATVAAAKTATAEGGHLTETPVDSEGRIDGVALGEAVTHETAVVSIVHGQPDIGTLQDVGALIATVRGRRPDARVHVDAGDTAGRIRIDVREMDCDALTVGAWPLGAPAWTGALYVREGARITPLIEGGIQEHGKRSGAEALPGIAALGLAAEIAAATVDGRAARLTELGERLIEGLLGVEDVRLNGARDDRIPGHVQVSAGDVEAETLVLALSTRGVAASPGSACTAYAGKAAPALEAIGRDAPWTQSAVLFTLGDATTEDEVDAAIDAFTEVVTEFRRLSPVRR